MSWGDACLPEHMAWLRPRGALLRSLSQDKDSEGRCVITPFVPKYLAKGRPSLILLPLHATKSRAGK